MVGKRLGVLGNIDPSHTRMSKKFGMVSVMMTYETMANQFARGEFDILPLPLIAYQPYEMDKIIGNKGGIVNYPIAFMTVNFILANGSYPKDFAQKSRQWFSQKSTQMFRTLDSIEKGVPKEKLYAPTAEIHQSSYDVILSQMRKEFIQNRTYDPSMITLIRHFRCQQNPKFIECNQ